MMIQKPGGITPLQVPRMQAESNEGGTDHQRLKLI